MGADGTDRAGVPLAEDVAGGLSSLLAVGPTGTGYFVAVERLPAKDTGVYALASGTMLICDAAIVAATVQSRRACVLITNGLGPPGSGGHLRGHLQRLGIELREATNETGDSSATPFDVILMEKASATRQFVTTGYFPGSDHITTALADLAPTSDTSRPGAVDNYLYVDTEIGSPPALAALVAVQQLTWTPRFALLNLGDCSDLTSCLDWIEAQDLPFRATYQVSCKESRQKVRDSLRPWRGDATLILTLGSRGALLARAGAVVPIAAPAEVRGTLSVGAGAVLSGAVLNFLLQHRLDTVTPDALQAGVVTASAFVRDFSSGRLWTEVSL